MACVGGALIVGWFLREGPAGLNPGENQSGRSIRSGDILAIQLRPCLKWRPSTLLSPRIGRATGEY